jgi:hypothetical protein
MAATKIVMAHAAAARKPRPTTPHLTFNSRSVILMHVK